MMPEDSRQGGSVAVKRIRRVSFKAMRCRRENLANYDGGCCGGSRVEESCCEFIFSAFWLRGDVWGLGFLCGRVVGVWVSLRGDGGWGMG